MASPALLNFWCLGFARIRTPYACYIIYFTLPSVFSIHLYYSYVRPRLVTEVAAKAEATLLEQSPRDLSLSSALSVLDIQ